VAYWLMMAVMWSGFVGRYFYAQIPRSLTSTALTVRELEEMTTTMREEIQKQHDLSTSELSDLLAVPDSRAVEQMSMLNSLLTMIWLDIRRPFQLAKVRRRLMPSMAEKVRTIGGVLSSRDGNLEYVIGLVRRQSWLMGKMAFLDRANQVFQLWHVVHRPFSYSFAVLAVIHITLVLLMGYF
jgi:hypothetical protein